jgi:polysaccharide pyruvyl transferase WcaK-like protein
MDKKFLWNPAGQGARVLNRLVFPIQKDSGSLIRFDTSLGTDNLGDNIIMHYCNRILDEMFPEHRSIRIGTHRMPTEEQERAVKQTKYKFVCGTNLLTSQIEHHWRWILPDGLRRKMNYRNVILMGVGWGDYQDACTDYSRMIYRAMLSPCVLHSVRDQYTLEKLNQAGFRNVLNTGCPTTWALTPEFCREIPMQKAKEVVTTITDYRRDPEHDNEMLAILSRNYDRVHLWLQGRHDEEYLQTLEIPANLITIPASLEAYEEVLRRGGVDYVGTRLHAGIHALNHKIRSIILAVDNRATEMGRDVNLPVIQRSAVGEELENRINSVFASQIRINQENIARFQAQFRR